jgi:hypothetical protein
MMLIGDLGESLKKKDTLISGRWWLDRLPDDSLMSGASNLVFEPESFLPGSDNAWQGRSCSACWMQSCQPGCKDNCESV